MFGKLRKKTQKQRPSIVVLISLGLKHEDPKDRCVCLMVKIVQKEVTATCKISALHLQQHGALLHLQTQKHLLVCRIIIQAGTHYLLSPPKNLESFSGLHS